MNSIQCPKCGGTGFIARFADTQKGVCFDCNGSGRFDLGTVVSFATSVRAIADAALAGEAVTRVDADAALAALEGVVDNRHSHVVRVRALRAIVAAPAPGKDRSAIAARRAARNAQ